MTEYFYEMAQAIFELPAREAVAGLAVALTLAVAGSGACVLVRKRVSDPMTTFCGLILVVSLASMAFGFGHSRARVGGSAMSLAASGLSSRTPVMPQPIGDRLIDDADQDGDHRLTPEEAARFVRRVDRSGKGWAVAYDIDLARRPFHVPRPIQDYHPDTIRVRGIDPDN